MMRNGLLISIPLWIAISWALNGCAATVFNPFVEGQYFEAGDGPGIQARGDWDIGEMEQAKASPDTKTSYFQLREKQTPVLTIGRGRKNGN